MITEDYCSFEVAKLLKEKKFDELCIFKYNYEGIRMKAGVAIDEWQNSELDDDEYSCVSHQMAMKWLREVHGLSVETFSIKGTSNIYPVFWKGNVVKLLTQDHAFSGELVGSYEEAVEEAIKYCLENLI